MSREIDRMLNQLDRAFRNEAWHGPAVLEALAGVTAEMAAARPIPSAHTIWELVLHMTYWKEVIRGRLAGEQPQVDDSRNFPRVQDAGAASWALALDQLEAAHQRLQQEVSRLDDSRLDEPTPGGTVSCYVLVHGMVQHDLYHAGQIAILRKPAPRAAVGGARRPAAGRRKKAAPKPKPAARPTSRPKRSSGSRRIAGRKAKRPAGRGKVRGSRKRG